MLLKTECGQSKFFLQNHCLKVFGRNKLMKFLSNQHTVWTAAVHAAQHCSPPQNATVPVVSSQDGTTHSNVSCPVLQAVSPDSQIPPVHCLNLQHVTIIELLHLYQLCGLKVSNIFLFTLHLPGV